MKSLLWKLLVVSSLVFGSPAYSSQLNITEGFNDLDDVNVPTPSNGDVAEFNSSNSLWESGEDSVTEDYVLIQHDEASATDGGTFTCGGGFVTRTLDTEVVDTGNHSTLASNAVTLTAGTYRFVGRAAAFDVDEHKLKLRNTTDSTDVAFGDSSDASAGVQTWAEVRGRFTIATSRAFELQHECTTTQATDGFGQATSLGTEIYATLEFWREGSGPASVGGFSGALVTKSADQTIGSNVLTVITFDQEEYDDGGWHDNVTNNSRLTVPAGVTRVKFCGNLTYGSSTSGERFVLGFKNGAIFNGSFATNTLATAAADSVNGCTGVISVTAGDFFECVGRSSGSLSVLSNVNTWCAIEAIP